MASSHSATCSGRSIPACRPGCGGTLRGGARSIPACAGEPSSPRVDESGSRTRVYPRRERYTIPAGGPHWRSIPACAGEPIGCTDAGLSPRVRGCPVLRPVTASHRGSIPACAGEPGWRRPAVRGLSPRGDWTIGENLRVERCENGLSPRVRGNQASITRSIPACATAGGLSPRVRGNQQNLRAPMSRPSDKSVYPRVSQYAWSAHMAGLSPRVRGNRLTPPAISA